MATSSNSTFSNIYLAKQNGELVLNQGQNPNKFRHAHERVLIVGGGVTGLTVSIISFTYACLSHNETNRTPGHCSTLDTP